MSAVTIIKGLRDSNNGQFVAGNTDVWSDMTSWSSWTHWNSTPDDIVIQLDDDLGSVNLWVPVLDLSYRGVMTATLKVSNTGAFAGEETTYTVDGTPVPIYEGRYYRWTLTVSPDGDIIPVIARADAAFIEEFRTQELKDIDTSTLSGSITGRIVTSLVGAVYNVQMTTKQSTTWVDRAYALPDSYVDPTNIAPTAGIVSKNPLTIILRDEFEVPVDGIVDITIKGTPKIYLTTNGVVTY